MTIITIGFEKCEIREWGWWGGVTRGHQVQFFKKCIFDLPYTQKAFFRHGKVKMKSRSSSAIFQKIYF